MKTSPLAIATIAGLALFAGAALAQTKTDQQNYPVRPVRGRRVRRAHRSVALKVQSRDISHKSEAKV